MNLFITYIYQPFFNVLVGIYWALGQISPELADMGIAVIIFSLVVKILTFPLTLAGERSDEEKREIAKQIELINREYSHEPIKQKELTRKVMRKNKRIVISTTFNLLIQVTIILMFYRIFTTGLEGRDFHLLYGFMPDVKHVNLMFLGKYDLSRTNPTLNLIQSGMILLVEVLSAIRSPYPLARKEMVMMQIMLPVGSYVVFMALPAGKKVSLITFLAFSAVYNTFRIIQSWVKKLSDKFKPPEPEKSEIIKNPSQVITNS